MSKNDLTCWLAETNTAISTLGFVTPCCVYDKEGMPCVNGHSATELYDFPEMKSIRTNLRSGIRDEGCRKCWSDEDSGNMSLRQRRNAIHARDINDIEQTGGSLARLEIALSNVCNMMCRHCSTKSSSRWKRDDISLGNQIPDRLLNETDIDSLNIHEIENLQHLRIYGGEPFYSKSHARLIEDLDTNNRLGSLSIEYVTNGSIFPDENIISSWKKLKSLKILLSIEDYGDKFDYFRTGGNFSVFYKNAKKFFELQSENIEVGFHFTLNVMNAYRADKILDYYMSEFPEVRLIHADRVVKPLYLNTEQWDATTLLNVSKNIENSIIPRSKSIITMAALSTISTMLKNAACNPKSDFTTLFEVNNILDINRHTKLEMVHPIFYEDKEEM